MFYSIFLIALFSCGSAHRENFRSRILFRDSTIADYVLLSVRNDALLAVPYSRADDTPQPIPYLTIIKIFQERSESDMPILYGGLIGFGAGLGGAVLLGAINHEDYLGIGGVPILLGGIGSVIGCNARNGGEKICDPADAGDRAWLKSISRYPDTEPPELQRIK